MLPLVPENQKRVFQKAMVIKPDVEMIGIIDKRGKMTESVGFDALDMSEYTKEMFLMEIALRTSMQKDFDEDLGPVNYCMTQRENRKFISIPTLDNNTILAVINNDCNHEELVNNMIQTLKNSDQFFGEMIFKSGES